MTLNNSHLLRAALTLAVVGIGGPGLFQLKPPQWLGSDEDVVVEVLEPLRDGETYVHMVEREEVPVDVSAPVPQDEIAVAALAPQAGTPQVNVKEARPLAALVPPAPARASAQTPAQPPASPLAKTEVAQAAPRAPARGGPKSTDIGKQHAALKPATVPKKPAVRARITAPPPEPVPKMAPHAVKIPAVPKSTPVPVIVSRDFTRRIPDSHVGLPVKQQKDSFIAITLPLILAANEEIGQRRSAIRRAAETKDRPGLERWAKLYRVKADGKSLAELKADILIRADYVPVSLAMAQAAIESGWGTSRFARQGNALFGQWAWQASAGLKPAQASNSRAVVRSFPNLFGSVRAYMHNLNTHPNYATFRERRGMMRGRTRADLGFQLANFMDRYAEIGPAYVDKLQLLIRTNDFGRFETARLR